MPKKNAERLVRLRVVTAEHTADGTPIPALHVTTRQDTHRRQVAWITYRLAARVEELSARTRWEWTVEADHDGGHTGRVEIALVSTEDRDAEETAAVALLRAAADSISGAEVL